MRSLALFVFLVVATFLHAQHAYFGIGGRVDAPIRSTMPDAQVLGGWDLHFGITPFARLPLYFEYKATWAEGANRKYDQLFLISSETGLLSEVNYSNKFNRSMISTKYFLNHAFNPIRPYIAASIGVGKHKTRMNAIDPYDENDPQLETRTTFKDFSGVYGAEAGVEIDFTKLFSKTTEQGHKLLISLHYLSSFRSYDYTDVRQMQAAPGYNEAYLYNQGPQTFEEPPYPYAYVSSENIYEQKVARVYQTPLKYWSIGIGYAFHF